MWWPWFLTFGLILLALGWLARDGRTQWVVGLWCLGIVAMQLPIAEPMRWLYAVGLWSTLTTMVAMRRGCLWAAGCMWLIPIGYAWLAFDAFGVWPLGEQGRNFAFGITEAAGVAAVLIGSAGVPSGLVDHWRDHRERRRVSILVRRGGLSGEAMAQADE